MTLAHPAAVLPLGRLGLPMTALVAGSVVPDIPLFLSWLRGYELTHSLLGILVIDVVLALAVLLLWFFVARDAVVDMAPTAIRARLAERVRPSRLDWLMTPVAAAVGAATHVLWDSFTHPDRWGPRHIEWLRADHGALPGLKWVQYASGVVGLVIVVWAAVRHLRSLDPVPGDRPPAVLPATVLPAVVTLAVLAGTVSVARSIPDGFHAMAFNGVVDSLVAASALSALACAAWHLARRRRTPVAG